MAHFQGTSQQGERAAKLAREREAKKKEFESLKADLNQSSKVGLKDINSLFSANSTNAEDQFKASTVGLVSAEEFKKKRELMERMVEKQKKEKEKNEEKQKKKKKKERKKMLSALTFDTDEIAPEDEEDDYEKFKKRKLAKDPEVDTHFLPDKEREADEERLRQELAAEWKATQEKIKAEVIQVTYSYWDGSGHRRSISVSKGTRIDQFLEKCRKDLVDSFHELRGTSCENLVYVKEDLIIPQHYTFYDLIITKARGKSGPLFHFDVHDDVRLTVDASVEKDESHAGKIVTRAYYERNQHIFPVNRWEVYDPSKKWDKYTIR